MNPLLAEPPDPTANPDQPMVPTNDPGATEAEYNARGFRLAQLYVGRFYPKLCDGKQWCCQFWRPKQEQQPNLL